MSVKPILYAEDEENDVFFLRRAFQQAGISHPLKVVRDGQEAMEYLSAEGSHETHPVPELMLLDLNMPKKNGLEVLKWIRQQQTLMTLPVIIFSSSQQEQDITQSYLNGANAYLVKPSNPPELTSMTKSLKDFWLMHNRFARKSS